MGQEQLQKILDREDIPSDVKETIKDYLLETSFPPREKLLEDNELLSAILEASPVGICLFTGSILGWTNNTMTRMLGFDEDSLNGQEARILFPSNEEYSRVYQTLYGVTEITDVSKVETMWLRQDGSAINVILHGKPIDISNLGKGVIVAAMDVTERKFTEEKLKKSEKKYRELIGNLSDIVVELDSEGNFVFFSSQVYEIFGYKPEEVIGKSGFEFIHPDDLEIAVKAFEKVKGGESGYHFEYRAKHKDGYYVQVSVSGQMIEKDKDFKLVGVISDISERKQAEEALRKSEEGLRNFMESSPDWIALLDTDLNYVDINENSCTVFGLPKEEIIGKNILDLNPALKDTDRVNRYLEVLKTGQLYIIEELVPHPKFGDLHVSMRAFKVGEGLGVIATDITERKQMEEELRKFKTIADNAGYGVGMIDMQGNLSYVNEAFAQMHGYTTDELIDRNFSIFHTEEQMKNVGRLKEQLEQQDSYIAEEVWHKRKDNTIFPTSMNGTLITDEKGTPQFMAATAIDITERKKAEKIRLELEQRRENFVWMTSHELRTPLTVVTGYVDFLRENIDSTDQDQLNTIFTNIKNNLLRLEKLTMDVSTVAQFGRGIFKITISDINFCTFFQQAIERYKDILGNQIVFYGCQREPPLIIKGDKERFQQVIDNLVNNAVKQTHPDFRQIEVHLEIYSADVRITIKDNGAGIASNNLEKIFEQFVSIETEYSATGTGIGLYLSRKIIEAHRGNITAQSKGLGKGATFIIDLPINFPDS